MVDTLATKQDLHEWETSIEARFAQIDARFSQIDAHLERRITLRMVTGIAVVSALVKLL